MTIRIIHTLIIISFFGTSGSFWCREHVFKEVVGKYFREVILFGPTTRPMHVDDCKRVCQLDVRCFVYQVLWTDDTHGYCETIGKTKSDFSRIETNSSYTYFGKHDLIPIIYHFELWFIFYFPLLQLLDTFKVYKNRWFYDLAFLSSIATCPEPMIFYPTTGHCYSFVGDQLLNWDDAWSYCKTIHPDAHLMDIQSQQEQDILVDLTGSAFTVWVGGRRFTTGVDDFVWVYTNTNISALGYSNWHGNEPTDPRDSEDPADCIKIKYEDCQRDPDRYDRNEMRFMNAIRYGIGAESIEKAEYYYQNRLSMRMSN
ncbi:hypothetical protein LSH36_767g00043 [Paralvinella palmiformis]|uniref:C-type lectin domain-containing protein n=1 Tax=Paralvinella palmiformis TaxID=53620 RepID=A0AAD9MU89_9ANNE|nr:hypothetical protein LSH36_767g00043 [Paralvinella palmiformis]